MVVCMRMLKQRSLAYGCILAGLLVLLPVTFEASAAGVRIYIDTDARTLQVLEGDRVIATFNGVAIGRFGKTYFKMRGDNKTPLGNFRVGWIGKQTRYHRFLGLTYPDMDAAFRRFLVKKRATDIDEFGRKILGIISEYYPEKGQSDELFKVIVSELFHGKRELQEDDFLSRQIAGDQDLAEKLKAAAIY